MGRLNSLADVLTDWEELLEAVRRSPDLLPDVEEDIALVARLLIQVRELKARQNALAALRQEASLSARSGGMSSPVDEAFTRPSDFMSRTVMNPKSNSDGSWLNRSRCG